MIIFLYGSDSYRRQKKLNKIIEEYRNKYSGISCDYFDLDPSAGSGQDEFLRLKEFSSQMLMFSSNKLAVLRNVWEADTPKIKEFIKKYLDSKDFTVLISEEKAAPAELKSLLKKSFSSEEFKELKGEEWYVFIQKEILRRKLALAPRAINFLAENFKGDGWGLVNELDKLSLFSKNSPIDLEDFKKIGGYVYQSPNIFDFINAVTGDWPVFQKIPILEKLFIGQEEPVKIFNIMASLSRLPKELLQEFADYDVKVKSGKLDYEEVLLDLAIK